MTGSSPSRCARTIREELHDRGHDAPYIVDVIHSRCDVTLLRAHRLARGWSLQSVVARINDAMRQQHLTAQLSHQRLSRWELGQDRPSPAYLDQLCRVYSTRADRLGFGSDYSDPDASTPASARSSANARDVDAPREQRLRSTAIVVEWSGGAVDHGYEQLRADLDEALDPSNVPVDRLNSYEERADVHNRSYRVLPPHALLRRLGTDLREIGQQLGRPLPVRLRSALTQALAQMSALVGITLVDLAQPVAADRWFRTAAAAASESNDRQLEAWIAARHALSFLYYDSPLNAMTYASMAERRSERSQETRAFAITVHARALARAGRHAEAVKRLETALTDMDGLDDREQSSLGVRGFPRCKQLFYAGDIYVRAGNVRMARLSHLEALKMYPPEDYVDQGLIRLNDAMRLLQERDVHTACAAMVAALEPLKHGSGVGTVASLADKIITRIALEGRHQSVAEVKYLIEGLKGPQRGGPPMLHP